MAHLKRRGFEPLESLLEDLKVAFVPINGDFASNIFEDKDNVYVEMHVPGIIAGNLEITVEDDRLRVVGTREEEEDVKDKNFFKREIHYGSFERVVQLPCAVNKEKTMAVTSGGVLKVTLPKIKMAEPTKIKVEEK